MISRRSLLAAPCVAWAEVRALDYVSINLLTGHQAARWAKADGAVGTGSLLKPFLVIAYGQTHSTFPVLVCRGAKDQCWLPRGHGPQDAVHALANSCNFYFRHLAAALDRTALDRVCLRYGLAAAERRLSENDLIGLDAGWAQSPTRALQAFVALSRDRTDRLASLALAGMRLCAQEGTARGLGVSAYAKTGTAPCIHVPRATGDGFVVALYPADQPRVALLARQHGTTGANTAHLVRPLLRSMM